MKSFVSTSEVNELCEALVLDYVKGNSKSFCVDIEGFITEYLKLNIVYAPFAEDDLTKEGFLSDGIQPVRIYRNGRKEDHQSSKETTSIVWYIHLWLPTEAQNKSGKLLIVLPRQKRGKPRLNMKNKTVLSVFQIPRLYPNY